MKKYIAFIGRSGSGKDYLTKKLINFLVDSKKVVKRFAFADPVKLHIKTLLNLSDEQFEKFIYDEDFKNNSLVSVSKMKIVAESDSERKDPHWLGAWTAAKFEECVLQSSLRYDDIDDLDIYMSLREFIVFYGTNVLQKCLGKRVWCNAIFNSDDYHFVSEHKDGIIIITDTRFPHEFKECEDKGFVFVKVEEKTKGKKTPKLNNIAESYMDMFHYDYLFENDKDDESKFNEEFEKFVNWILE